MPKFAYTIACAKQTVRLLFAGFTGRSNLAEVGFGLLVETVHPGISTVRLRPPQPERKRSLFNVRIQDYCLMPEPVGVPVIVAALTISAPSFVLFQSVSSRLSWVTCKVRK